MFERAEGLINHCKWQCRRMVEGGDEANHSPINLTPRGILSECMCAKTATSVCVSVWVQLHLIQLSREPVKKKILIFFPRLLISFIHTSNPDIVAYLILERMHSRKFSQCHSVRAAVVYRHSLPVDSTPSHGLFSPLCSVFIPITPSHSLFRCHLANS